jgi:hypothetical protein
VYNVLGKKESDLFWLYLKKACPVSSSSWTLEQTCNRIEKMGVIVDILITKEGRIEEAENQHI